MSADLSKRATECERRVERALEGVVADDADKAVELTDAFEALAALAHEAAHEAQRLGEVYKQACLWLDADDASENTEDDETANRLHDDAVALEERLREAIRAARTGRGSPNG